MDKRWKYKNFNMVIELDIAGEFIYNGIQEINRLALISNDAPTFVALYNISVGIERLQKIVYVLWGLDESIGDEVFEKNLITHSHTKLRDEIKKQITDEEGKKNIIFSKQENEFFGVIQEFYNSIRYGRYNINERNDREIILLEEYLIKYIENIQSDCFVGSGIVASPQIKELFGRVIGNISKKYYRLVRVGSERNNSYTYELRTDSKAEKVFRGVYRKNSLMEEQLNERIALKELLIFFRRANDKHAFFKYIETINPLDFDVEMIVEYLQEITKGIVPQMLVDEVESLYEEKNYSIERVREVDLFADTGVWYEYPDMVSCSRVLHEIFDGGNVSAEQVSQIVEYKQYISDDEIKQIIEEVEYGYREYVKGNASKEQFLRDIEACSKEFDEYLLNEDFD